LVYADKHWRCQDLRAYLMLKVVHAPYRIAATRPGAGPDEADAHEALLRARASRARRIATVVCGALSVLSIMALAESPPSRARARAPEIAAARATARVATARDTVAAARTFAEREQARFASTMNAVLDADVSPERAQAACGIDLPETSRLTHKQALPLLVVASGDRHLPSPSVAKMLADVNRADEYFATGRTVDAILLADALSSRMSNPAAHLRYDVVLVTTSMRHPVRTSPTSFEPGEMTARAYLYDFAEHAVTCVGDIQAVSSRTIEYSYVAAATGPAAMDEGPRLVASLDEDLEMQIQRALVRGALVKVDGRR